MIDTPVVGEKGAGGAGGDMATRRGGRCWTYT